MMLPSGVTYNHQSANYTGIKNYASASISVIELNRELKKKRTTIKYWLKFVFAAVLYDVYGDGGFT